MIVHGSNHESGKGSNLELSLPEIGMCTTHMGQSRTNSSLNHLEWRSISSIVMHRAILRG